MDVVVYDKVGKEADKLAAYLLGTYPQKTILDADIASFSDGADGIPVKAFKANIKPLQDLHGYDNPWPAGGGKNLVPNVYVFNSGYSRAGVTYTYGDDGIIYLSGTATAGYEERLIALENLPVGTYTAKGEVDSTGIAIYVRKNGTFVGSIKSNPVTFDVGAGDLISLTAVITNGVALTNTSLKLILNAGSTVSAWTPYSNICPISGHTGLTVARTGKNLLDPDKMIEYGSGAGKRWYYDDGFILKANQPYTFSVTYENSIYLYIINKATGERLTEANNVVRVAPTEDTTVYFQAYKPSGISDAHMFQLELGSTASTYEPYIGITILVSWETEAGTVYGGTLDVVTGVLTVSHAIVEFDGSSDEQWGKGNYENYRIQINGMPVVPASTMGILACNRLKPITFNDRGSTTVPCIMCEGSEASIELRRLTALNITTVAELRTWLSNNPVSAVYPLATPIVYQLDPVTVETLYGSNAIYVDCGTVDLTYRANIGDYINNAITTAVANALNA